MPLSYSRPLCSASLGLLVMLAAHGFASAQVVASDKPPELTECANPASQSGFTVSISTRSDAFHLGESIPATIALRNVSSRTLYIHHWAVSPTSFDFDAINIDTKQHLEKIADQWGGSASSRCYPVEAGTSVDIPVRLDRRFRFTQLGTYRIRIVSANPDLGQLDASNILQIRIIPPTPEDSAWTAPRSSLPTGQVADNGVALTLSTRKPAYGGCGPIAVTVEFRNLSLHAITAVGFSLTASIATPGAAPSETMYTGYLLLPLIGEPVLPIPAPHDFVARQLIAPGWSLYLPLSFDLGSVCWGDGSYLFWVSDAKLLTRTGWIALNPSNKATIQIVDR